MKLKPGTTIRALNSVGPFPCPFCKGNFSAAEDPPSVMHSIPVCAKFVDCEPDAFLKAARLAREGRRVS